MNRAQRRAATRGRGPVSVRPATPDLSCPHCASEVAFLTRSEFAEHLAVLGIACRPLPGPERLAPVPYAYWFCHGCCQGGALLQA